MENSIVTLLGVKTSLQAPQLVFHHIAPHYVPFNCFNTTAYFHKYIGILYWYKYLVYFSILYFMTFGKNIFKYFIFDTITHRNYMKMTNYMH